MLYINKNEIIKYNYFKIIITKEERTYKIFKNI